MSLVRSIIRLDEVDSTNDYARRENLGAGTVVVARRQTAGRGRRGRKWISQEGGIFLSVVLDANGLGAVQCLPLVFGVALHEALSRHCGGLCLKWPNDLLHGTRKLAGILCEIVDGRVIVGVGINVTNPAPLPDAVSLFSLCGEREEEEILEEVLGSMERWLGEFARGGFGKVREEWKRRSCIMGKTVIVVEEGISGIASDIDSEGCLLIRTPEGMRKIVAADVSIRLK